MPPLIVSIITSGIRKAPVPFFLAFLTRKVADMVDGAFTTPEIKLNLDYLESIMAESAEADGFFCGTELTGADFMMIFPLEGAIQGKALTETKYPKLYAYVRRMQNRDAYKRAGDRISEASGVKFVPFSEVGF